MTLNNNIDSEDAWSIIGKYFKEGNLEKIIAHQLESYNNLISTQLPGTIEMFNPVIIRSDQFYVKKVNKYSLEVILHFDNFALNRPQIHENNGATKLMFPQEARLRNFTYAANSTVDIRIQYVIRTGENLENMQCLHNMLKGINIGKIPIMLKSDICLLSQYEHIDYKKTGECSMDPGGYFIINGSEKTILGQERAAENQVYCFKASRNITKCLYWAEIKSVPDFKRISPKQLSIYINKNVNSDYQITVAIPRIKKPIPLFILFRALGVITDKEICKHIILDINNTYSEKILSILKGSAIESNSIMTQEQAIDEISSHASYITLNVEHETGIKRKREFTEEVLKNDIFPHCRTLIQKKYFLGYMTLKLIYCLLEINKPTDRDSYENKRIDLSGVLINNLYRNFLNKMVKDMQKQIVREINNGSWRNSDDYLNIINSTNIYKIIKSTTIENGIKRALATGDFGLKSGSSSSKVGVAQVVNRLTSISHLSHSRRITTPVDKNGKLIEPRRMHCTTWGYICPAETPEGGAVGVVKNLSAMALITIPTLSEPLYDYVEKDIMDHNKLTPEAMYKMVKVFINGAWIGCAKNPTEFYTSLKNKKKMGLINPRVSITFNIEFKEIKICSDAGRLIRPVLRVENNKLILTKDLLNKINKNNSTWNELIIGLKQIPSIIEYIDPDEQNLSMIAMYPSDINNSNHKAYTHCEIHPSLILGICASCIPFPDHNQSPRNTYQCAMGKQALGVYVTNWMNRMDKTAFVLSYPHRPLVDTRLMGLLKLNKIPSGTTVIVAIMTKTGYNQEDSILMNEAAVNRGLFQTTLLHTEKDEDKKLHGDDEIRCKPDPSKTKGTKFGNYDKLNHLGLIPENTQVENMDIIMGKTIPIREARNDHTKIIKYEDLSRCHRTCETTYMDKNYVDRNGDGYPFWKGRLRILRQPVTGDKFSSRHGQKGTIGNLIREEDMPFTAEGIKPDIIINPHAIPSRMTIAQLKETLLGKVLLELGLFGDGTAFSDFNIDIISKHLQKLGMEKSGNEILYDGETGEMMQANIFMGPAFYQRLKHMVDDKVHSRGKGPMVNLTRQPAEGRARDGGLRFGEMERDCTMAHGAAAFTKGRMYDASDKYYIYICNHCGIQAAFNNKLNIHCCHMCDNRSNFKRINIPYACKLLIQELRTMNIGMRMLPST